MKRTSPTWSALALILGVSVAAGCASGPDDGKTTGKDPSNGSSALSTVNGHVTAQGSGKADLGFAGSAALDLAKSVTISALGATGQLTALAQTAIGANGAFSVQVPADAKLLIVQALDAAGKIVGSSILEAVGDIAGQVTFATPISTESSIEAQALIDIATSLPSVLSVNGSADANLAASLRSLVDADLAASISSAISAGADAKGLIHALAKAAVVASHTQALAIGSSGAKLDSNVYANLEAKAALALNGVLDANLSANAAADASAQFSADLDAALKAATSGNLSAELTALGHAAANLTFNAALDASIAGMPHTQGLAFASLKSAATLEANQISAAVSGLLQGTGALDAALRATANLTASLSAAANPSDIAKARADFVSSITAAISGGSGSLLANVTGNVQATLDGILQASAQLNAQLDGALTAALGALGKINLDGLVAGNLDATLQQVVDAFTAFLHGLNLKIPVLTALGASQDQAKAITNLIAVVQGTLKAALPMLGH